MGLKFKEQGLGACENINTSGFSDGVQASEGLGAKECRHLESSQVRFHIFIRGNRGSNNQGTSR